MSLEPSEDWDVDSYKMDHESKEHWELRKKFMVAHKGRIVEDQLVCLSHVLANMEYLGCRYETETMLRVAELGKGIVDNFKESRKDKLKRIFVTASDAASLRIKKNKEENQNITEKRGLMAKNEKIKNEGKTESSGSSKYLKPVVFIKPEPPSEQFSPPERSNEEVSVKLTHQKLSDENTATSTLSLKKPEGPFSDFVLFLNASTEESAISIIQGSATLNTQKISWRCKRAENKKGKIWSLFLGKELLASETGVCAKSTMASVAEAALDRLKKSCYVVKVKSTVFSEINIDRSTLSAVDQSKFETNCPRPKESKNKKSILELKKELESRRKDQSTLGAVDQSKFETNCPRPEESKNEKSILDLKIELESRRKDQSTLGAIDQSKFETKCPRPKESVNEKSISDLKTELESERKDRFTLETTNQSECFPSKEVIVQKPNLEKELGSNSVGLRIMKLMGWEGGGLGKNKQGIEEPIKPAVQVRREGLGSEKKTRKKQMPKKNKTEKKLIKQQKSAETETTKKENANITKKQMKKRVKEEGSSRNLLELKTLISPGKKLKQASSISDFALFREKFRCYLENWIESNPSEDLVFSSEFDNVERKAMHRIAQMLDLKTKSYGEDNDRHLVVCRKFSPWEIVKELAAGNGSSDKYELIYPPET